MIMIISYPTQFTSHLSLTYLNVMQLVILSVNRPLEIEYFITHYLFYELSK